MSAASCGARQNADRQPNPEEQQSSRDVEGEEEEEEQKEGTGLDVPVQAGGGAQTVAISFHLRSFNCLILQQNEKELSRLPSPSLFVRAEQTN